jgi:hypothetical protein
VIRRVYEVDPLECPRCGGPMKVVSFIERCQHEVIERILRHCGLWEGPLCTLANPRASPRGSPGELILPSNEPLELELVMDDEFLRAQVHEAKTESAHELQLVLDPEYL